MLAYSWCEEDEELANKPVLQLIQRWLLFVREQNHKLPHKQWTDSWQNTGILGQIEIYTNIISISNDIANFTCHTQLQIRDGNYCYLQCEPNEFSSQTSFAREIICQRSKTMKKYDFQHSFPVILLKNNPNCKYAHQYKINESSRLAAAAQQA